MATVYSIAHLLHLLAASIWIGGHLVLALGYLPRAFRTGSLRELDRYEAVYEKIGLPSLIIAVATGIYMGINWYPIDQWFTFQGKAWILGVKALLVLATIGLAIDARLRIIARARRSGIEPNIIDLGIHIMLVTIIAVGFLVLGWLLRNI